MSIKYMWSLILSLSPSLSLSTHIHIYEEQYGFIFKWQIHDDVSLTQEALHYLKLKNIPSIVMKLDLSKAFDKVNWTFVRLALIQLGMNLLTINWIMGCIESSSFIVLINGAPSFSFRSSWGLRQGCPLSSLFFLLVTKCLNFLLKKAQNDGLIKGLKITILDILTQLFFVDDVILFGARKVLEFQALKKLLDLFCISSGMRVNRAKSIFLVQGLEEDASGALEDLFHFSKKKNRWGTEVPGLCAQTQWLFV